MLTFYLFTPDDQVNEELKPPSDDSGVEMNSLQMDHLNHARYVDVSAMCTDSHLFHVRDSKWGCCF